MPEGEATQNYADAGTPSLAPSPPGAELRVTFTSTSEKYGGSILSP
jgi:hypothetical protein